MSTRFTVPIVLFATLAASWITAASESEQRRLSPHEIDALPAEHGGVGTSLVGSMQTTVLFGDPSRPGLYTIRIKIPPHTNIRPHTHRDTRTVVVSAGVWYFGYGAEADPRKLKRLPAGSFYTEPGHTAHFAQTRDEGAVVFITGYGPSDTVYVKPADNPATH